MPSKLSRSSERSTFSQTRPEWLMASRTTTRYGFHSELRARSCRSHQPVRRGYPVDGSAATGELGVHPPAQYGASPDAPRGSGRPTHVSDEAEPPGAYSRQAVPGLGLGG
jgi:hypothetical protein